MIRPIAIILLAIATIASFAHAADESAGSPSNVIRIGIIGLDTSHVPEFTKIFNNPKATGNLAGFKVVAAYPGGSSDIPSSFNRIPQYTKAVQGMGVEIVNSIPDLLSKVDVVLLESVDGRPHLEQARPVLAAHKPVFIDKPLAGSLVDAIAIEKLGEKYQTPWFSSSSLRYGPKMEKVLADPKLGKITGCDAWSPSPLEEHHPDLFWYGVHGVELLYTVMGPGCQSVTRAHTQGCDVVVGTWADGRIGVFRGLRDAKHDYGVVVYGTKQVEAELGFEGYEPLVEQIARFFKTKKPPVSAKETIEIFTFMEAADESKRQNGTPVKLADVLAKAEQQAQAKVDH